MGPAMVWATLPSLCTPHASPPPAPPPLSRVSLIYPTRVLVRSGKGIMYMCEIR